MVSAKGLITFLPDTEIMDVVDTLLQQSTGRRCSMKKELVGLIDDKDCLKVIVGTYHNRPVSKRTASRFMSNVAKTLNVHADIYDVVRASF